MECCETGLSPRVRGSRELGSHVSRLRRSIPACAGQPNRQSPMACHRSVYPRVCGAATGGITSTGGTTGLSPRVRGSHDRLIVACQLEGSIPTCAGQPDCWAIYSLSYTVYPRVCGAAIERPQESLYAVGLSPRVRGSPLYSLLDNSITGSIPACAGQPQKSSPR